MLSWLDFTPHRRVFLLDYYYFCVFHGNVSRDSYYRKLGAESATFMLVTCFMLAGLGAFSAHIFDINQWMIDSYPWRFSDQRDPFNPKTAPASLAMLVSLAVMCWQFRKRPAALAMDKLVVDGYSPSVPTGIIVFFAAIFAAPFSRTYPTALLGWYAALGLIIILVARRSRRHREK